MKKILIILLTIAMILTIPGCRGEEEQNQEQADAAEGFEIYLATTESVREFGYYDHKNLVAEEVPVLTGKDIRNYYWESHIIELNGSFLEKLSKNANPIYESYTIDQMGFRSYQKGGSKMLDSAQYMAFIIVVNGEQIYSGTFPGSTVMPSDDEKLILGDISDDSLRLFYNGDGFDVRNQDAVYDYMKENNKLSTEPSTVNDSVVDDLEDRIESLERENAALLQKYNELLENGQGNSDDTNRLTAVIEWQKARINLYMRETQEGERHREFSDLLGTLDPTRIESLATAADYFRQTAGADVYENDRLFNVFEEFYDTVIRGIPLNYSMADINNEFMENALRAGVSVDISNGDIRASALPSYLKANFELFLSDILNEYLMIREIELSIINQGGDTIVTDDETLFIGIEQLADLVYIWKNFSDSYPNNYPFNIKARLRAEYYMDIYLGIHEIAVSPIYDSESLELISETKESYIRFLNEYRDSAYYRLIADLFIVLEGSGFKLDSDVLNFLQNIDYGIYGF